MTDLRAVRVLLREARACLARSNKDAEALVAEGLIAEGLIEEALAWMDGNAPRPEE